MAFQGYQFSYGGVSSYFFGLMIYDIENTSSQGQSVYSSPQTIVEEKINRRYDSLYYGSVQNKSQEIKITVGIDMKSAQAQQYIDRWDMDTIGRWLTGTAGYQWLEIEQPDLSMIRYKCVVSDLKIIDIGWIPYGLEISFVTDSPFAYLQPEEYTYTSTTTQTVLIYSQSSYIGYYYPKIEVALPSGSNSISIINKSDSLTRECKFSGFNNTSGITITIDNKNQIITSSTGINMYQYFNFNFFRMVKGDNSILISGNATVKFTCEFPVNAAS